MARRPRALAAVEHFARSQMAVGDAAALLARRPGQACIAATQRATDALLEARIVFRRAGPLFSAMDAARMRKGLCRLIATFTDCARICVHSAPHGIERLQAGRRTQQACRVARNPIGTGSGKRGIMNDHADLQVEAKYGTPMCLVNPYSNLTRDFAVRNEFRLAHLARCFAMPAKWA